MTEQLSIFDIDTFEETRLIVGDMVKVNAVPRDKDIESLSYFETFGGKKGTLIRIVKGNVVCFEVEFANGKIGIFYESEITKIRGNK